jgi:Pup amidohydrolase
MLRSILAGIETEFGLLVEGRGAEDQVEDSKDLVRAYTNEVFVGWDYRHESPRADLRGFRLDRLAVDPEDAKFDVGKSWGKDHDVRADRILPNGARFYNDHGHPEYSTPECFSLDEFARHDVAGETVVLDAARSYAATVGRSVQVYKNNTDFHGASYGTHESYLVPRSLTFPRLYDAVLPMLVARIVLCGAGKVGAENGKSANFQLSQRADFFVEPVNAETLFRRPVFNTRDEPHADPTEWIRLHVISGDANMIAACTRRKAGLVKLALHLAEAGTAPVWRLADAPRTAQSISRDETYEFRMSLDKGSWTTAYEVLESYFAAAEATLELTEELSDLVRECRGLLVALRSDFKTFARSVDWAAKRQFLEEIIESEGLNWRDPVLQAYDLEYHNVDPNESLHQALVEMDQVEPNPPIGDALVRVDEPTRAVARGLAVSKFSDSLVTACWRSVTFRQGDQIREYELPPNRLYDAEKLGESEDVGTFIKRLEEITCPTETD